MEGDGRVLFLLRDYNKDLGCRSMNFSKKNISHLPLILPFVLGKKISN